MNNFNSLKNEEKQRIINNAHEYYLSNKTNIDLAIKKYNFEIEPNFEQLSCPKNWMPSQWVWFFKYVNKKPSLMEQFKSFFNGNNN